VSVRCLLYASRNLLELEPHYSRHIAAMTEEGLREKAQIAAELAWRDLLNAELLATLPKCGYSGRDGGPLEECLRLATRGWSDMPRCDEHGDDTWPEFDWTPVLRGRGVIPREGE
jgi:hypothetical protein